MRRLDERDKKPSIIWKVVDSLVPAIPAAVAIFSAVCMTLLVAGNLSSLLVLLVAGPVSIFVLVYVSVRNAEDSSLLLKKERNIFNVAAFMFVAVWVLMNASYTAQDIFVYRDPAVYTVASEWLAKHEDLDIRTNAIFDLDYLGQKGGPFASANGEDRHKIYVLGQHLLPVIGGLSGRVVGSSKMLHINLFIGGLAMLAVYGLARVFIKPRWAFFSMVILGVTLPFIVFTRDMFTEPLTMLFVIGGVSLLCSARSTRDKTFWLFSGMTIGAAAMVRTDNFISVYAVLIFSILTLAVVKKQNLRKEMIKFSTIFFGISVPSLIGFLDLYLLSKPTYLNTKKPLLYTQLVALALIAAFYLLYYLRLRKESLYVRLRASLLPLLAKLTIVAIALLTIIVVSRPLWHFDSVQYDTQFISGREAIIVKSTPFSNADSENLALQLVWYLGLPTVVLGFLSATYFLYMGIKKQKMHMLLPSLVLLLSAAFYLVVSTITPDQVWSSRRLLPTIIPLLIIFCLVLYNRLEDYLSDNNYSVAWSYTITVFFVLLIAVTPAKASYPFFRVRTFSGQMEQIRAVCAALPNNAVVFWAGTLSYEATQTTRTYCDKESYGIKTVSKENIMKLRSIAEANGLKPVIGIQTSDLNHHKISYGDLTEIYNLSYHDIDKTFGSIPRQTVENHRTIMLGDMLESGELAPLGTNP